MAVTSSSLIQITMQGDVEYSQQFSSDPNPLGSGQIQIKDLTTGNNTITVPDDAIAVAIIIPDSSNDVQLTLKKVSGDTGIALGLTGQSLISLQGVTSFVLLAADDVTVRLIFT